MTFVSNLLAFFEIVLLAWLLSLGIGTLRIILRRRSLPTDGPKVRDFLKALLPVQLFIKLPAAVAAAMVALWWHPEGAMMIVMIAVLTMNAITDDDYPSKQVTT